MKKKVAILGGNSTYIHAPLDDPEWEIWGCNSLWRMAMNTDGNFKATRWFEMHPIEVQTAAELKAIEACPIPIYTLKDESKWAKTSRVYPLDEVLKTFGYRYFTCTFAYQIALAMLEGFTAIGLYGVELWQGTPRERFIEKPCVEFWLGAAAGTGVEVRIPDTSRMAYQKPLYGYDYDDEVKYVNRCVDALFYQRAQELNLLEPEDAVVEPVFLREGHA